MTESILNNVGILLNLRETFERGNVSPAVVNLWLLDWHRCSL